MHGDFTPEFLSVDHSPSLYRGLVFIVDKNRENHSLSEVLATASLDRLIAFVTHATGQALGCAGSKIGWPPVILGK